jgi:membrane protease YdiL (CAAX protease family)
MAWPPAWACRRVALVIFGLALALHLSVSVLALSLGLDLRAAVVASELVSLLGLSLWLALRMGLSPQAAFALRRPTPVHWLMALGAALPLQVAGGALQHTILDAWPDEGQMRELIERNMLELIRVESTLDLVMLFLTGVVVAAICEEVLFRGLLLQLLARHGSWTSAILIVTVLFSAFHLDPVGFLPRLPVGAFLGILVWRSGSLYPAILAHAAFNFIGLFVVPTLQGSLDPIRIAVAGSTAGVIFLVLLIVYLRLTEASPPPLGSSPAYELSDLRRPSITGEP